MFKYEEEEIIKEYEAETNTSEYFLTKYVNNIKSFVSIYGQQWFHTYQNQNYTTIDYYGKPIALHSTSSNLPDENYWIYPLDELWLYLHTWNFPVTRTISIIVNSNTLPVYTIDKDITVDCDIGNSRKQMIIPSGDYNYVSFDNFIKKFITSYFRGDSWPNYYKNLYFNYSRLMVGNYLSVVFINNDDFNKYYGLLHMIYTYPEDHGINTNTFYRKFSASMSPVYRSLHIPEGYYTANALVDYINNNSEYYYTRANTNSLPYTQFLAKIVNNDIVIYTNDGTSFFINPICHLNTYQEKNWASQHKLCPVNKGCIKYNLKKVYPYKPEYISMVPEITGPFRDFSAEGLPEGLEIDNETGEISGVVSGLVNGITKCKITSSTFVGEIILNFNLHYKYRSVLQSNIHDQTNVYEILSIYQSDD